MSSVRQICIQYFAIAILDSVKAVECEDVVTSGCETLHVKRAGAIYKKRTRRNTALVLINHQHLCELDSVPNLHRATQRCTIIARDYLDGLRIAALRHHERFTKKVSAAPADRRDITRPDRLDFDIISAGLESAKCLNSPSRLA